MFRLLEDVHPLYCKDRDAGKPEQHAFAGTIVGLKV